MIAYKIQLWYVIKDKIQSETKLVQDKIQSETKFSQKNLSEKKFLLEKKFLDIFSD